MSRTASSSTRCCPPRRAPVSCPTPAGTSSRPRALTSLDLIRDFVLDLVDGKAMAEARGARPEKNYGNAALTVPGKFYFAEFAPYYDEMHAFVCETTRVDKQAHLFK